VTRTGFPDESHSSIGTDLAKLGLKALLCGTLASYLSATLAGIII